VLAVRWTRPLPWPGTVPAPDWPGVGCLRGDDCRAAVPVLPGLAVSGCGMSPPVDSGSGGTGLRGVVDGAVCRLRAPALTLGLGAAAGFTISDHGDLMGPMMRKREFVDRPH
jgi:hypothetical protein